MNVRAEAEEQYQTAVRAHLQMVSALIDVQFQRIKTIEREFRMHLRMLEEEFDTERAEIIASHMRLKKEMLAIMAAMEAEFRQAEAEQKQEFESQREEIKNRNSEEYNVLKISLESTVEELERHFEQAHQAYLASTDARTQAFKQLTERDAACARIIEKRMRKLIRLHEALAHWRVKIMSNSREWEQRNKELKAEKDKMNRHYKDLKTRMNRFRHGEYEKLKILCVASGRTIKALKEKKRVVSKMLRLAEVNGKMETEQEKIVPFFPNYVSSVPTIRLPELEMVENEFKGEAVDKEDSVPSQPKTETTENEQGERSALG
ncbi:hypothetical protein CBR_g48119 [Chara braunii]|uniref:Dynein regulatory complex protein 1/2 N-terminal domain-containing protein n=1 Tax=Chara braunii TaxID=69332 RepID=A0A388M283_CHABU|nr:hypothetical protein CBR_g48119 [Chara braunii]|eukprot:GBG88589.1 hypothetical protein CBR_g48119 [Chara braunii]